MHPSTYLLAAVAAFAVPSHAFTTLNEGVARSEALRALDFAQLSGLEFARLFDAAARPSALLTESAAPAAAPETDPAPKRLLAKPGRDRYDDVIRAEAGAQGLDPRLVKSVIAAESEFSARAKSPAGARGLMQVMPTTAESVGVSGRVLFDPIANIRAGTRYLAYLFARAWARYRLKGVPFAQAPRWLVARVVAAYNAGPRWVARRPEYRQTREYVRKVMLFYRSLVSEVREA